MRDGIIITLGFKKQRAIVVLVEAVIGVGLYETRVLLHSIIEPVGNDKGVQQLRLHILVTRMPLEALAKHTDGLIGLTRGRVQARKADVVLGRVVSALEDRKSVVSGRG